MINPIFRLKLKERRRQLSLTQKEAATMCGLTRSRWSLLECGKRIPSEVEKRSISNSFQLGPVFYSPPGAKKKLLNQAQCLMPPRRVFLPHQDRPTQVRVRACLRAYPDLTNRLISKITTRVDGDLCEHFSHLVCCDSKLEALHLLHLLSLGGDPGLWAPAEFGHTYRPIVDCRGYKETGARPRPGIFLFDTWYFFQVSFKANTLIRVDLLCWKQGWSVLEINGFGHDASLDHLRGRELGLPVTYIDESKLLGMVEKGLSSRAA
ncbi:MAG: helix-turn-helix transcriptional regulator [Vulcanimicrobiota bacterium]